MAEKVLMKLFGLGLVSFFALDSFRKYKLADDTEAEVLRIKYQ